MTDQSRIDPGLTGLSPEILDLLLPLHVIFDGDGKVVRSGPTFNKLVGEERVAGRQLRDLMSLRGVPDKGMVKALQAPDMRKLNVSIKALPDLPMRGHCVPLADGAGHLLRLCLGLSFAEAVERRDLTMADLSPCDQTLDLLYLREAIEAVAAESERLTDRLVASEQSAMMRAATDELTGLANRRSLSLRLDQLTRHNTMEFSVMQIDLDHFKPINDEYGHHAGDAILRRVGEVLRDVVRDGDVAARTGGDEFVLVLRGTEDPVTLDQVAQRIFRAFAEPITVDGVELSIQASIGTTRSSFYAQPNAEQMLRDADEALYVSKRHGRGKNCFFKPHGMVDRPLP